MRNPIFLPNVPDRKPRTECGCQPVAFMRCFKVAPPERFTSSSTLAVLLPWRTRSGVAATALWAALAPFLAGVVLFAALALVGRTWGFGAAILAFLGGCGFSLAVAWAGSRFAMVDVVMVHAPLAVVTAIRMGLTSQ